MPLGKIDLIRIRSNCSCFDYNEWSNFSLQVLKIGRFLYAGFYYISLWKHFLGFLAVIKYSFFSFTSSLLSHKHILLLKKITCQCKCVRNNYGRLTHRMIAIINKVKKNQRHTTNEKPDMYLDIFNKNHVVSVGLGMYILA